MRVISNDDNLPQFEITLTLTLSREFQKREQEATYSLVMPIRTKRWNDPRDPADGFRLLVTRYRPRGVSKADETWDAWEPALGPSKQLHAAVYTTAASPIPWPLYRKRYLEEQRSSQAIIDALAQRVGTGETITLLCSSACERESRCHRSILKELIQAAAK